MLLLARSRGVVEILLCFLGPPLLLARSRGDFWVFLVLHCSLPRVMEILEFSGSLLLCVLESWGLLGFLGCRFGPDVGGIMDVSLLGVMEIIVFSGEFEMLSYPTSTNDMY
ncbi:hypothetical protein Taro_051695 [Colocasia esculenta]|uniref:Uncharacterized protein n=1 Tax=Colocasia esculenta TaxID=4460 RepID=A0A843XHM2_COLES|nr:hypothetical protein [Colocasia esculenta]